MLSPSESLQSSNGLGVGAALSKTWSSRSSPALVTAASFNLRALRGEHCRLFENDAGAAGASAKSPYNTVALQRQAQKPKVASFEKIDLIGGNGRWRQRRAKEDFERRRLEEEELARQERMRLQEKERRRHERRELRRRAKEEEEQKRREEEERKLQERLERERIRKEQQEKERQRQLEEERERQRRMPKTCHVCSGSGICQACGGKGFLFATHLVSTVNVDTLRQYGKSMQGCQSCGGCKQGIRGDLKTGVGKCATCVGYGKIWPNLDELRLDGANLRTRY
mmetsp:Transcript_61709/g.143580  ORF Transcript_61709/g.143580 Transcript_61709/m.143580 type:complete len:282 (+) Transcript_61709:90-935(+)